MSRFDRRISPSGEDVRLELECDREGLWLAAAPLLQETAAGFAPRPSAAIAALVKAAYDDDFDAARLEPGLKVIARALNDGDLGRAMVAAVHLRLGKLNRKAAVRIARADEVLAKYDPEQPRDWHGRWSDGSGGRAAVTGGSKRRDEGRRKESPSPLTPATYDLSEQISDRVYDYITDVRNAHLAVADLTPIFHPAITRVLG